MTSSEYLNMAMAHLEEAVSYHNGAVVLKLRATGPMSASLKPEVAAQRRQLTAFAAVLLEKERDSCLKLGIGELETYFKEKAAPCQTPQSELPLSGS